MERHSEIFGCEPQKTVPRLYKEIIHVPAAPATKDKLCQFLTSSKIDAAKNFHLKAILSEEIRNILVSIFFFQCVVTVFSLFVIWS